MRCWILEQNGIFDGDVFHIQGKKVRMPAPGRHFGRIFPFVQAQA